MELLTLAVASSVHFAPLPLHGAGATPWSFSPAWFALLGAGLPLPLWISLALWRAWEDDPDRLRRAGRRELQRLLARMRRGGTPRPADLHAWCRASAHAWDIRAAAPTKEQLSRSLGVLDGDHRDVARWRALWQGAERNLYAADARLPPEWLSESIAAAERLHIPSRRNWLPKRLRHWWPALASALCIGALMVAGPDLRAAAGATEGAADVPDARTAAALRAVQRSAGEALRRNWNDWAAHYDIGAQQLAQGNSGYAAAHLTAAFLQRPASAAVRDDLRWSLQQASVVDPTLSRLLYGAWFQRYPALLSPASWQRLGLVSGLMIGFALCGLVLSLYLARTTRSWRRAACWVAAAGIIGLVVSTLAWRAWGDLHRPDVAMLVESINLSPIPSDLVTEAETQSVAADSMVLTQKSFLGWRRVRIIGVSGVTDGWTRSRFVMPLYAPD